MENKTKIKHVLIVEDTEDDALMMSHVIEELLHLKATVVNDGYQAIKAATQQHFDLILVDMHIPRLTGNQVAHVIRRMEQYKHIPIIAITAYDHAEMRKASLGSGCDIYLTKPVDIDTLVEIVQLYLKGRR